MTTDQAIDMLKKEYRPRSSDRLQSRQHRARRRAPGVPLPPSPHRTSDIQCLSSTASATSRSRCGDLDASLAFYGKLGFPEMLRLLNEDGEPWIVYLRVTDALYLELFPGGRRARAARERPRRPRPTSASPRPTSTPTEARLTRSGSRSASRARPSRGVDGNRGMWIEDPDGNRIEIMEMAPDCIQHQAVEVSAGGQAAAGVEAVLRRTWGGSLLRLFARSVAAKCGAWR